MTSKADVDTFGVLH